jgi:hypothetical protein
MRPSSGSFWAYALSLLAFACLGTWVFSDASRWSALLVTFGGFASIFAGYVVATDTRGAGAVWYRGYIRYRLWPFHDRHWENPRRYYRWAGTCLALLGLLMIVIGFWRFVESP